MSFIRYLLYYCTLNDLKEMEGEREERRERERERERER